MARLEVITGPMFSGKSEELIRRLNVAMHAKKKPLVLKPVRDTRCGREIYSRRKKNHDDTEFEKFSDFPAFPVELPEQVLTLLESHKPDILAMDEGQFFDLKFVELVKMLMAFKPYHGLTIIISGLDMTSEGDPFGPMPHFMAMSHRTDKMLAVCFKCRQWPPSAEMTYYKAGDKKDAVVVGGENIYEARCRTCHSLPE